MLKTGGVSILVLLLLGINFIPENHTHYCSNLNITMDCDGLSKYYNLPNGNCIRNLNINKRCKTGWELILKQPQETKKEAASHKSGNEVLPDRSAVCNPSGCIDTTNN